MTVKPRKPSLQRKRDPLLMQRSDVHLLVMLELGFRHMEGGDRPKAHERIIKMIMDELELRIENDPPRRH